MANPNLLNANLTIQDSVAAVVDRVNNLAMQIATSVVTVDGSNTGAVTSGNSSVNGYMSITTLAANTLHGGTAASPGPLTITGNVHVSNATYTNDSNTSFSNTVLMSNNVTMGSNLSLTSVTATVNVGGLVINSTTIAVPALSLTGNVSVGGSATFSNNASFANAVVIASNGYIQIGNTVINSSTVFGNNATQAAKWTTPRNLALTGDVSGNVNIDGSANVTLTTVASQAAKWTTARNLALSGDVSGNVNIDGSGNVTLTTVAAQASKWTTARNIALTGDVTGNVNIDGTGNVSIPTSVAVASKLRTVRTIGLTGDASGSTLFDGTGNAIVSATVAQAAKLTTGRQITMGGDVSWGVWFDGSGDTSASATIQNGVVTNTKMANMGANTIKGNNSGGGAPQDLTVAQVVGMLGVASSPWASGSGSPSWGHAVIPASGQNFIVNWGVLSSAGGNQTSQTWNFQQPFNNGCAIVTSGDTNIPFLSTSQFQIHNNNGTADIYWVAVGT